MCVEIFECTDGVRLNIAVVTVQQVQQGRAVRSFLYLYVSRSVLSLSTVIPLPVGLSRLFIYLPVTQGRNVTWLDFMFPRKPI